MITIETTATIKRKLYKFNIKWTPNRLVLEIHDEDRIIRYDSTNFNARELTFVDSFFVIVSCESEFKIKSLDIAFNYFKSRIRTITQIFSGEIGIKDCPICDTCKHIYQFHPIFDENLSINMNTTYIIAL